jgi:hypothetical protein
LIAFTFVGRDDVGLDLDATGDAVDESHPTAAKRHPRGSSQQ